MKGTIILGIALFISNICKSQLLFKINAGCSYNQLITDVSSRKFTKNTNEIGYSSGFQFKYLITNIIGFEAGICWIQKNHSFERTENYSGIFDKSTNNYIQIPFTVQIKIFEKKRYEIFLENGVFVSYLVYSRVNGVLPNIFNTKNQLDRDGQSVQSFYLTSYSEEYHFNKKRDNRSEFGLQAGFTLQYNMNEKNGFFVEYVFYQSLTDTQKKYMINQISKINRTFLIFVGFVFRINCNK